MLRSCLEVLGEQHLIMGVHLGVHERNIVRQILVGRGKRFRMQDIDISFFTQIF